MSITVAELIAQVRQQTDRVNDPTLTDAWLAQALSDGARSLYDIFLESAPHWFQSSTDFTLTGNTNTTDTAPLPDDFQLDLGLDWLDPPGLLGPLTIRRLPTFLDRNRYIYGSTLVPGAAYYQRQYECQGGVVRVYPFTASAGTYRLWYQRQLDELALPITVDYTVQAADIAINNSGTIQYNLTGLPTIPAYLGATLTVTFSGPNTDWNCTDETVTGPTPIGTGNHAYQVNVSWPGGSFTSPAAGTASITYQPAGTVAELPQVLLPWKVYVLTYAVLSVRNKFEEESSAERARLDQEAQRARRQSERRDSDLRQIPILGTGPYGRVDSPDYDSGIGPFGFGDV